jgi:tetratricopeptide (TPR) repeat protein
VGALCLLDWRNSRWKRMLALIGGVCAVEAIAMGYDVLRFLHFTGPLEANSTYAPDLHPASILAVFWHFCRDGFSPFSAACCGVALLAVGGLAYRKRTAVIMPLAFIVAGLLALIPNATIPRHYDAQYAWNAAPLAFAAVLFIPLGKKWSTLANAIVLFLALVSIRANAPVYASTEQQWLLGQERINAQIIRALPEIRAHTAGAHRILVSGLGASYHPWEMSDFLRQYFGRDVEWGFVIQRTQDESLKPNIALLKSSSVRLDEYDSAVRFQDNGQLRDVLVGSAFRAAATETPQAVLIPSLTMKLAALHAQPDDFTLLLQVGAEAVAWGEPAWALPYLQRASQEDSTNPYPWFFMGEAESDLKNYDSARADYEKAIATAGRDQNPAFAAALSTLPAR